MFTRLGKRILLSFAVLACVAIGLAASPALAQIPPECNFNAGTSRICLTNNTNFTLVGVLAGPANMWSPGGSWITIPSTPSQPGNFIMPGRTKNITFPVWGHGTCIFNIFVKNWQGQTHPYYYVNVCKTTVLPVGGW